MSTPSLWPDRKYVALIAPADDPYTTSKASLSPRSCSACSPPPETAPRMPPPSTTRASLAVSPGPRLPGFEPEAARRRTSSSTGWPWSTGGGGGGALARSLPRETTRRLRVGRGGAAERGGDPGGEGGEGAEGEPGRRRRGGDGGEGPAGVEEGAAASPALLLPPSSSLSAPLPRRRLSCRALASLAGAGTTLAATVLAPREAAAPAAAPARAASCLADAAAAWRAATAEGAWVASSRARRGFGIDGEGLGCCGGGGGGGAWGWGGG